MKKLKMELIASLCCGMVLSAASAATAETLHVNVATPHVQVKTAPPNVTSSARSSIGTKLSVPPVGSVKTFSGAKGLSSTGAAGSQSDLSQQNQLKIQTLMQQKSQFDETLSNVEKHNSDTQTGIISNIKN